MSDQDAARRVGGPSPAAALVPGEHLALLVRCWPLLLVLPLLLGTLGYLAASAGRSYAASAT